MKRTLLLVSAYLLMMTVSCFAIGAGVGIRAMGMGGTGIATANDITAAYFNPAGLMYGPENFEFQTFAGGQIQGITALSEAISSSTNFIRDNFDQDFNTGGAISGGMGFSVKKVGLSLLTVGTANFRKPASSVNINMNGNVMASVPLTLGSTFATPGLPIASLSVGVNLKSLAEFNVLTEITSQGAVGKGTSSFSTGQGFGFDIGAQGKITPLITVGGVIRNLSASIAREKTSKTLYVDLITGDSTEEAEVKTKTSYTPPAEVGVGAGVVIPVTGTLIACDLENYSDSVKSYTDTHIGVEQGFFLNLVMLRAGYYTYGPTEDSFYTYGLGLYMGPASLGVAAANSTKDSINSMSSAQVGVVF